MPQRGVPDILILFIRFYSRLYKCQNVLGEYGAVMDDGRGTNGDRPARATQKPGWLRVGCARGGRRRLLPLSGGSGWNATPAGRAG